MTQKVYFLPDKQALAYFQEKATPEFWDQRWLSISDLGNHLTNSKGDKHFIPAVRRYLPIGSTVLEGGCGLGHLVHALHYQGYKAIGIDFASGTVNRIKQSAPELDVRLGDVHALEIADGVLDGYISVGVIEHFWSGYIPIVNEMYRTLRVGGFLFVSFPYLSPLRKIKIVFNMYPKELSSLMENQCEKFYQFAFNVDRVRRDFVTLGFELKEQLTYGGLKGFKDEVTFLKPWLQNVYDGKYGARWKHIAGKITHPFASHMVLLIMQKVR